MMLWEKPIFHHYNFVHDKILYEINPLLDMHAHQGKWHFLTMNCYSTENKQGNTFKTTLETGLLTCFLT